MANTIGTPKSTKKLPFTSSERELIVALVRERPIIEDKRTHAKNIELKKQAWDELTTAFNAQPYVFTRNSVQLKRCWENIKTQRKKELSQESAYMMGTGGGPPQSGSTDSSNNIVDVICPYINLKVPGVIDSNSIEIADDVNQNYVKSIVEISIEQEQKQETDSSLGQINKNNGRKHNINSTEAIEKSMEDVPPLPKKKCLGADVTTTSAGKLCTETETRIKRCHVNIQHDEELHKLRLEREKVLIERENNLLMFEKEMHNLQLQKAKLELAILKKDFGQKN